MTHCSKLILPGPTKNGAVFLTGGSKQGGCSVYETRLCPKYTCAWLDGYGDEEDRPDKSLVMFDNKNRMTNAYQARPLAPDHEKTLEGREVINRMSKSLKKPVVVMNFYERKIVRVVGRPIEEDG